MDFIKQRGPSTLLFSWSHTFQIQTVSTVNHSHDTNLNFMVPSIKRLWQGGPFFLIIDFDSSQDPSLLLDWSNIQLCDLSSSDSSMPISQQLQKNHTCLASENGTCFVLSGCVVPKLGNILEILDKCSRVLIVDCAVTAASIFKSDDNRYYLQSIDLIFTFNLHTDDMCNFQLRKGEITPLITLYELMGGKSGLSDDVIGTANALVDNTNLRLNDIFREIPTFQSYLPKNLSYIKSVQQTKVIKRDVTRLDHVIGLNESHTHYVASYLSPQEMHVFSCTCRRFFANLWCFVPCLRSTLFNHQLGAVSFMRMQECLINLREPYPNFKFKCQENPLWHPLNDVLMVNLCTGQISFKSDIKGSAFIRPRGGIYGDEPGLGKTVVALSLILISWRNKATWPCCKTDSSSAPDEQITGNWRGAEWYLAPIVNVDDDQSLRKSSRQTQLSTTFRCRGITQSIMKTSNMKRSSSGVVGDAELERLQQKHQSVLTTPPPPQRRQSSQKKKRVSRYDMMDTDEFTVSSKTSRSTPATHTSPSMSEFSDVFSDEELQNSEDCSVSSGSKTNWDTGACEIKVLMSSRANSTSARVRAMCQRDQKNTSPDKLSDIANGRKPSLFTDTTQDNIAAAEIKIVKSPSASLKSPKKKRKLPQNRCTEVPVEVERTPLSADEIEPISPGDARKEHSWLSGGLEDELMQMRVYRSFATLVVVPKELVDHWLVQIDRHVAPGVLVVKVLAGRRIPEKPSPRVRDLCKTGGASAVADWQARQIARNADIVLTSFDRLSREDLSGVFMRVHWFRVLVDEGHRLGSSMSVNNYKTILFHVRAERRWIMTGTPTPRGSVSDISYLEPLITFLKATPYSTHKAWRSIRDRCATNVTLSSSQDNRLLPIDHYERGLGFIYLKNIVEQTAFRTTKIHCKSMVPSLFKKTITLKWARGSEVSYNCMVELVKRNLVLADWFDPSKESSLFNPSNRGERMQSIGNVLKACVLAGHMDCTLPIEDVNELLDSLDLQISARNENVKIAYTALKEKDATECDIVDNLRTILPKNEDEMREFEYDIAQSRAQELKYAWGDGLEYSVPVNLSDDALIIKQIFSSWLTRKKKIKQALLAGTLCENCGIFTKAPLVTPCCHMSCVECIEEELISKRCPVCCERFHEDIYGVPAEFIEMSPAYGVDMDVWRFDWDRYNSQSKMTFVRDLLRDSQVSDCYSTKKYKVPIG
eukprot:GHVL01015249.1.p1 GENE.GHVL01015249.1~~GHVL01015249.1.p1  ORF type:complete len:1212 (+),score=206.16 GHVL01015249.1:188-3823(+)